MAQSRSGKDSRQNSKKTQGKRPGQQAIWLTDVDVPGWFDSSLEREECLGVYYPKEAGLPSPVYEAALPGEFYCTYYAHQHPELKEEAAAASLAARLCVADSQAGTKAEGDSVQSGQNKLMLKELKKMADNGCVTAACCLGYLYMQGRIVRKNSARAEQYLRFAAAKNDPLACFCLSTCPDQKDGLDFLNKSYELGFPTVVFFRTANICTEEINASASELKMLAAYLAALANRGSMKSLYSLLHLLGLPLGAKLRREYAPAMLALLDGLAAEDYAPAVLLKAEMISVGTLYEESSEEEAGRLYLKARDLGAEAAAGEYAVYMLTRAGDDSLTRKEKEARVQAARAVLEEEVSQGRAPAETAGMLGSMLVMSDDDAEFKRGIKLLEDNLAGMHPDMPLRAVNNTFKWFDRPERHKPALRLLNRLVRKKDMRAVWLRGRYYLDGGLAGRRDTPKGMLMLAHAARAGIWEASYLLAEIYLFGLYNMRPNNAPAAAAVKLGSTAEGGLPCSILYSLMQIGEIPGYAVTGDRQEAEKAIMTIASYFASPVESPSMSHVASMDYLVAAVTMARLNAGNPLGRFGQEAGLVAGDVSVHDAINSAVLLALHCKEHMRTARLGPLCFLAYALGKIGKTQYAGVFATVFADELSLKQWVSCDEIADYLRKFVANVPQSYTSYRLACPASDRDEERPLY